MGPPHLPEMPLIGRFRPPAHPSLVHQAQGADRDGEIGVVIGPFIPKRSLEHLSAGAAKKFPPRDGGRGGLR